MIAVDTNIPVYAHRADSEGHPRAVEQVTKLAVGKTAWAIPWPCVHEFLAIVSHPSIFAPPTPMARAIDQMQAWFESPSLALLGETPTHWTELRSLIEKGRVLGPRIHNARIAAICLEHGVRELWTADRDFNRFPGLATVNPLVSQ